MVKDFNKVFMRVTMEDGSRYDVPVMVIATNRAEHYKDEFGGDLQRSLDEDTLPLFEQDEFEIQDWAQNNMNWDEVEGKATKVEEPVKIDFQEGWMNGEKEFVTK